MTIYIVIRGIHDDKIPDIYYLRDKIPHWIYNYCDSYWCDIRMITRNTMIYFTRASNVGGQWSCYIQIISDNYDIDLLELTADLNDDEKYTLVEWLANLALPREAALHGYAGVPCIIVLKFANLTAFRIFWNRLIQLIKEENEQEFWWFIRDYVVFNWFPEPEMTILHEKINKLTSEEIKYLGIDELIKKSGFDPCEEIGICE